MLSVKPNWINFFEVTALLLSFAAAEICRLRWNWFYLIILACLSVIGYSSPLPSFHQFVTNPTAQQLNGTGREHKVLLPLFQVQLSIMSQRTSFLGARFCSHYHHYCTCTIGLNFLKFTEKTFTNSYKIHEKFSSSKVSHYTVVFNFAWCLLRIVD